MRKKKIIVRASVIAIIISLIISLGIITPFTSASAVGSFAGSMGRDSTLTGRTDIWNQILSLLKNRLVLGFGFGGFWTSETVGAFAVNESHNGYLGVIMELGFVGLLIALIFLLSSCKRAQLELFHDYDWGVMWICFLLMFAVHNISESTMNDLASLFTTIVVFLSISAKSRLPDMVGTRA